MTSKSISDETYEVSRACLYALGATPVMMQVPRFRRKLVKLGEEFQNYIEEHPEEFIKGGMFNKNGDSE